MFQGKEEKMFWEEVLESIKALLQIYGVMMGGTAVAGLAIAVICLIVGGAWKGLEWLGIPALLARVARAWAVALTDLRRLARVLSDLVRLVLGYAAAITPTVLLGLIIGVGPWFFVYFVTLNGAADHRAVSAWAAGSITISLPLCLSAWLICSRLNKQKVELVDLPRVIAVAALWVAPALASFPVVMTW